MTMLDRMRRHKGWLKWSLALVVPHVRHLLHPRLPAVRATGAASPSDVVAEVDGRDDHGRRVPARLPRRSCRSTATRYGGNMNEQMLKQLGIDQQILQQMVDEQAALAEARAAGHRRQRRRGARADPRAIPAFQENGQFIGEERYRQLLRMQRPPMTTERVRGRACAAAS